MKKVFYLVLICLPFILSGCGDDDSNAPQSITETTWESFSPKDGNIHHTINFLTESEIQHITYTVGDEENSKRVDTGTYNYNKPGVSASFEGYSMTGKIDGRTLGIAYVKDSIPVSAKLFRK